MELSPEFQVILLTIFMISFWVYFAIYLFISILKTLMFFQKKSIDLKADPFLMTLIRDFQKTSKIKFVKEFFFKENDFMIFFLTDPKSSHYLILTDVELYGRLRKKIRIFTLCTIFFALAIYLGAFNAGQMKYLIK